MSDVFLSGLASELARPLMLLWTGLVVGAAILGLVALVSALSASRENMHLPLAFGIFGLITVIVYVSAFDVDVSDPPMIHTLSAGIPFTLSACAVILALLRAGCGNRRQQRESERLDRPDASNEEATARIDGVSTQRTERMHEPS
jgi:hypothetical protein